MASSTAPTKRVSLSHILSLLFLLCLCVVNAQDGPRCGHGNDDKKCPAEAPCCSSAGYCGTSSAHCGPNCRVEFSTTLNSCQAVPVCQTKTYTFGDSGNARLAMAEDYLVPDPDNVDFIVMNGNIAHASDSLVLTLNDDSKMTGTALAATRAMRYGRMSAELQTAWSGGVVTAAILIGQGTEEVDIEFVGSKTTQMQTNLFYNYKASGSTWDLAYATGLGDKAIYGANEDTSTSMHTYEVEWSKDALVWNIDGNHVRSVKSADFHIPELPMFMQMSIWPGGSSPSAGTRDWAGAPDGINWHDPRYIARNHSFEVFVKSVTLECGDAYGPDQFYTYKLAADGKTIVSDVV